VSLNHCCAISFYINAVKESRIVIDQWLWKYYEYRPHGSLKGKTPKLFLEQ